MTVFHLSRTSVGIAATVGLHLALAGALLRFDAVHATAPTAPVAVMLVDAPGEKISPEPPKPVPREKTKTTKPIERAPKPTPTPEPVAQAAPSPESPAPTPSIENTTAASVTLPRFNADYLNNPPPVYPPIARRMGETGRVLLRVVVRQDGSAADVQVNKTSGYARLDQAALDAVRKWRFVPAKRGDVAVEAPVLVPISFTLEG